MSDDQSSRFVTAVNQAIADLGLAPEDAAATLAGCYAEAARAAWGAERAATQTYILSLALAKRAGIELPTAIH